MECLYEGKTYSEDRKMVGEFDGKAYKQLKCKAGTFIVEIPYKLLMEI